MELRVSYDEERAPPFEAAPAAGRFAPERNRGMRRNTETALAVCLACALSLLCCLPAAAAAPPGPGPDKSPGMGLVPSRAEQARRFDARRYLAGKAGAPSASVDLSGSVPPIGNQGPYQSCVGWATGYYAKSWYEKREHPTWDLADRRYQMSPQFVWNGINGGGDNPTSIDSAMRFMENYGCTDWAQFPYDGAGFARRPDAATYAAAEQYRISGDWGWFFLKGRKDPDAVSGLKAWINAGNPLVMGIPIYSDFPGYGSNPASPYYDHPGSDTTLGGHAVFVAGYDDNAGGPGRGGFLVINSWGPRWNGNGRIWLSYGFVQNHVWEAWHMSDRDSAPRVSSVTPLVGGPGQAVTIEGDNLGACRRSARVGFQGGASGKVVTWSNRRIRVRVPSGARTGSVCVYDWEGRRSNGRTFTVGPPSNAAADWLFAEGATWPGFDEWVLLQNPGKSSSTVRLEFLTPGGEVGGPTVSVPPSSRLTVHVNEFVPNADVSTAVLAVDGPPVCAERAMYFAGTSGKWGAHDSVGAQAVADTWYLAEGATWPGYDEWVLVMNPFNERVTAAVTFHTPQGERSGPRLDLAPNSRQNVHVNEYVPDADVSAVVRCTSDGYGVVAERSVYVETPDGKAGCHNSVGSSELAGAWGLAEGATRPGYEEWVLVQNPTADPVRVELYFLTPAGAIRGPLKELPPGRRASFRVNDYAPDRDVSTVVFTGSEDQKVVAERAQYVSSPDGKRGSHCSLGSAYASRDWLLPEGCTLPGFEEWVLVMNPDRDAPARFALTFMTPQGEVPGPEMELAPASRASVRVNDYCACEVSTRVVSDGYVIAERAMYMDTPQGKRGATCSLGVPAAVLGGPPGSGSVSGAGGRVLPVLHASRLSPGASGRGFR